MFFPVTGVQAFALPILYQGGSFSVFQGMFLRRLLRMFVNADGSYFLRSVFTDVIPTSGHLMTYDKKKSVMTEMSP